MLRLVSRHLRFVHVCAALFVLLAMSILAGGSASAAPQPDSCFAFDAGTGTITDYYPANPGCGTDVEIPSTIGGVSVVSLGFSSFYNDGLTSVVIPSSVVTIGSSALSSNNLPSVAIPDSVITIENDAFNTSNITSLTLGNSVATIGDSAFAVNSLTSLVLPESVTTIGAGAFDYNNLTAVALPSSITSMGHDVFSLNRLKVIYSSANLTLTPEMIGPNFDPPFGLPEFVGLLANPAAARAYLEERQITIVVYESHPELHGNRIDVVVQGETPIISSFFDEPFMYSLRFNPPDPVEEPEIPGVVLPTAPDTGFAKNPTELALVGGIVVCAAGTVLIVARRARS